VILSGVVGKKAFFGNFK
jgi:hypothetical protein